MSWVDRKLWQWGDWSRGDLGASGYSSVLGNLIKRKQIEDGDGLDDVFDKDLIDPDEMVQVDQALQVLTREQQLLVKLKYKARREVHEIAERMRIHRNTVGNRLERVRQDLEPELRSRLRKNMF
jgi:RNA polymerase sigma factor (sigma-70 family)